MSQGDVTSTLLPTARVDFYTSDDATAATAQKLSADWRFARVGVQVKRDGIDAAIADYTQSASPELVIIETSDISDAFIQKLGNLAVVCAEGTDAVVIGPTNDVHLYRSLVGMGVRDYLVRPVAELDITKVIAQALVEKRGLTGARLIAVVGSKGGVGTTTVAQILAWNIAERQKQKTLLMDAAGSNGTIGVAYGLEPSTGFAEAVRVGASGTEDDMKRIMQTATENLSLLVCGGEPVLSARPDPDGVETLVNRLLQKYPVVVIDLSGASRAVQKRIVSIAARVVMVTTPMLSALRNARTYLAETKTLRTSLKDVDLVINMQGMAGSAEVPVKDIQEALGLESSVKIPYAPKIFASSETTGKPVGQDKAAQDILEALMGISTRAASTAAKDDLPANDKKANPFDFLKKTIKGKK